MSAMSHEEEILGNIDENLSFDESRYEMDNEKIIIAKGGNGGFGNARYKTKVQTAPRIANDGQIGQELEIDLELKVLADVGLVGFPNAGKSTFISKVSNAKPKIADYPFTTLTPNLGIVRYSDFKSFVIADIPGIIKGASSGRGLGHYFLRQDRRRRGGGCGRHTAELAGLEAGAG